MQKITNCLWFDSEAEDAVKHYISIFKNSSIGAITHFTDLGFEHHGKRKGSVMSVNFFLNGQEFVAINGGKNFKFNESISLMVNCIDQNEIDYYWQRLSEGGEEGPCGWLKDKFGLSWQVVPTDLNDMINHKNSEKANEVLNAIFGMKKINVNKLHQIINT